MGIRPGVPPSHSHVRPPHVHLRDTMPILVSDMATADKKRSPQRW